MFSFFSNLVCIRLCTQKFKSTSKQIIEFLRKEHSLYYLNSMVYYSILYMCICIVYVHVYHVYKICLLLIRATLTNYYIFFAYLLDIHRLYVSKNYLFYLFV